MFTFELHLQAPKQWSDFVGFVDDELKKLIKKYPTVDEGALGAHFIGNVKASEFFKDPAAVCKKVGSWVKSARGSSLGVLTDLKSAVTDDLDLARKVRWGQDDIGTTGQIKSFGCLLSALTGLNVVYVLHESDTVSDLTNRTIAANVQQFGFRGRTPLPLLKDAAYVRTVAASPILTYLKWHAHRFAVAALRPALAGSCEANFDTAMKRLFPRSCVGLNVSEKIWNDEQSLLKSSQIGYMGSIIDTDDFGLFRKASDEFVITTFKTALFNFADQYKSKVPGAALDSFSFLTKDESDARQKKLKEAERSPRFGHETGFFRFSRCLRSDFDRGFAELAVTATGAEALVRRIAASFFLGRAYGFEEWQDEYYDLDAYSVNDALMGPGLGEAVADYARFVVTDGDDDRPTMRYYNDQVIDTEHATIFVTGGVPLANKCDVDALPLAKSGAKVRITLGSVKFELQYKIEKLSSILSGSPKTSDAKDLLATLTGAETFSMDSTVIDESLSVLMLTSKEVK